jgi:hypothetical protein
MSGVALYPLAVLEDGRLDRLFAGKKARDDGHRTAPATRAHSASASASAKPALLMIDFVKACFDRLRALYRHRGHAGLNNPHSGEAREAGIR